MGRRKISFGYLAMRMGIVNAEDLDRARALGARSGTSLEAVLLARGLVTPELASHVHDALRLALGSPNIPAL